MPYSMKSNIFEFDERVVYCGYSICNWKLSSEYKNKYLKIAIILMDTKSLIDSYFNRKMDKIALVSNEELK